MVQFPVETTDFSLLRNAKVGFGAQRRPLASVVRALYQPSLRATRLARLLLFILKFPIMDEKSLHEVRRHHTS